MKHAPLHTLARTLAAFLLSAGLAALTGCMPSASIETRSLTTEFRANPAGLHTPTPRLAWKLAPTTGERGSGMSAYRIIAARSAEDLQAQRDLIWDTGVVKADERTTNTIEYAGTTLRSRDHVSWRIQTWDQAGRDAGWSEPASFSVGILSQEDWSQAEWIGLDDAPQAPLTLAMRDELRRLPYIRQPGPPARSERQATFQTRFSLRAGIVTEAWFAGGADQFGAVVLNSKTLGSVNRWEPARALDAREALVASENILTVAVRNEDGFNPAATGMLFIRFADGSDQRIVLDKSWRLRDASTTDIAGSPVEESRSQPWGGNRNTEHFMPRAPYLRTTFSTARGKTIAKATLFSTALGVYQPRLNGNRVGIDELTPGWTEFTKRVYHQTYDVTAMITPGENCLGAVLGDGWYAGLLGYTGKRQYYGGPPRFKARLEITYADGTVDTIVTSPRWVASFGPIIHNDLYMGSDYDARLEMPGWDTPSFPVSDWKPVDTGLAPRAVTLRQADVTQKVTDLLAKNKSFQINPQSLGDPAFGVVKVLNVDYTVGGVSKSATFQEGEVATFPRPGEAGAVVITRAVFTEPPPAPTPPFIIEPQPGEPVRRFETLATKAITEPRPGRYVFDLGQNMVGWTRLTINGRSGQRLTLRHAEMLNPDGTPYTSNLRGATQTDYFTLRDGPQTLEPPFTFHGFRFVEISDLTEPPTPDMLVGIVAHTAITPAGTFTCSNPLVNQLVHNIIWGQKGNYLEVPTDCPQRDERLGWTGDAQFFANAASYNFDIASFMSRWLKTLAQDAQFPDGTFAHVAPKVNERGGSTAWGDAAIICSHAMYRAYGDTRVITDHYEAFLRYMAWLDGKTTSGISKVGGFGDWVNLGDPTSSDLIDTAQRILLLGNMSEMARAIGKEADADRFDAARAASITAFRARFLAPDGSLKESGQTGYAMAFTIDGIIPAESRKATADAFVKSIEAKNWHLATGFIGTPRLLPALYAAGRDDVAERLLLTEDYPSWLYQVKLGATTMWERWDGWTPERGFQDVGMNSFNHYAFGAVGDALYRHVAGISALEPGYRKILIEPRPMTPTKLHTPFDRVDATYDSAAGLISSAWTKNGSTESYHISIPPSTTAEIRLRVPAGATVSESGKPIAQAAGLKVISAPEAGKDSTGIIRLIAESGTYHLTVSGISPPPPENFSVIEKR
ncbi:MAG: family 78 glycoside hydrolase catalytic domain [Tepidisphaera sp.]